MQDSAKYLIHANIVADSVVERSDVVGAIFGQTEGLLGEELDLRDLQESSKVGRIDVQIESESGQSFGEVTIATNLDKVETAILAAALETIDRVGPCRSTIEIERIEDVRAAKRREVVERARTLLTEDFEGAILTSDELVEEVRRAIRVDDITEFAGSPAGPRVADSDAIIIVEGRADVLTLLQYGIKNAVAVKGTDIPGEIADLTKERTVTAFLDGDRGGEVVLKELVQVGNVDHVAFAPSGRSVEDLSRPQVMAALRNKVPYETVADASRPHEAVAATDGSARPVPPQSGAQETMPSESSDRARSDEAGGEGERIDEPGTGKGDQAETTGDEIGEGQGEQAADLDGDRAGPDGDRAGPDGDEAGMGQVDEEAGGSGAIEEPETLRGHVRHVIDGETGQVRLLDSEFRTLADGPADEGFELVKDAEQTASVVVFDGELPQRVLDVAAQRGVEQIVARSEGDYVKQPASVRVRPADELLS